MARCIMVQGTMSGAGKSLLATALCRIFRQDGLRVAPFKSQNMALNSYITRDGLEMGRAQVAQAEAAGREPDVRMNPVLLKPSSDTGSQVIVNGEVRGQHRAAEYFRMTSGSWCRRSCAAYERPGGGVRRRGHRGRRAARRRSTCGTADIVNMGLAELVNAPVLLAGDIDRGGVFAQLYGTAGIAAAGGARARRRHGHQQVPGRRRSCCGRALRDAGGAKRLGRALCWGVVPYTRGGHWRTRTASAPRLAQTEQRQPGGHRGGAPAAHLQFYGFCPRWRATPRWACGMWGGPRQLGEPDLVVLPGHQEHDGRP